MILILKMEDGTTKTCDTGAPTWALLRDLQNNAVETIIAGDVKGGKVLWEKQFTAVDVMPSELSARSRGKK